MPRFALLEFKFSGFYSSVIPPYAFAWDRPLFIFEEQWADWDLHR